MDPTRHTFGGSALDRHVFDFDTDDAGDPGNVITDPAPDAPDAPDAPEPWSLSQEDWELTQQAIQYLAQQVIPQQPPEAPPAEVQLPDPWERPDSYHDDLKAWGQSLVEPYQKMTEKANLSEAESRAQDIMASIVSRDGDFLLEGSKEKARGLANMYVNEMAQQYGFGPEAAEQALEKAAKDVRDWEQAVGAAYHDRQINQLSTLGSARQEPGPGADGAQQFVIPEGGSLMDVVRRHTGGGY